MKSITFLTILILISSVIVFDSTFGQEDTQQSQFINFHSSLNCSNESFLESISSSSSLPASTFEKVISLYINGMWQLLECQPHEGTGCNTSITTFISNDGSCLNLNLQSPINKAQSVTFKMFGNGFKNESALYFFTTPEFKGITFKVNEEQGLSFSSNEQPIGSWLFTGDNKWAIYDGENYTGKVTCLTPLESVVGKQYGFTWNINSGIKARSIRYVDECSNSTGFGRNILHFYQVFLIGIVSLVGNSIK